MVSIMSTYYARTRVDDTRSRMSMSMIMGTQVLVTQKKVAFVSTILILYRDCRSRERERKEKTRRASQIAQRHKEAGARRSPSPSRRIQLKASQRPKDVQLAFPSPIRDADADADADEVGRPRLPTYSIRRTECTPTPTPTPTPIPIPIPRIRGFASPRLLAPTGSSQGDQEAPPASCILHLGVRSGPKEARLAIM